MNRAICHRCQGLMHPIDPLDPLDVLRGGEYDHIRAWRCVACGDLIDSVIMENRSRPRKQRSLRQRSTPRQPVFNLETAVEAHIQPQSMEPKGFSTAPQFTTMVN